MTKVKVVNGVKFYPVCGFQRNQHKIYYWYTKAQNEFYDDETRSEKTLCALEEAEKMLDYFTCYTGKDGLVYAPYKDGQRIKEMIVCYDLCH